MKRLAPFPIFALTLLVLCADVVAVDWPQAAGPDGNFVAAGTAPAEFSVSENRNILWRTSLPSTGQGTPIVVGGKVFVTSHEEIAADTEMGRDILGICLDAATGKELWRRTLPGTRETDLSSLFSDNTAASPVADAQRVCFVNVGGSMACFDHDGKALWTYEWVPFGRHHSRQHEPILHDGKVIVVQVPRTDLEPEHTTKAGAAPLGRGREWWTRLQAFDLATGERAWVAKTGTGVHATSLLGTTPGGLHGILTGRGGGHQPPEEPYGLSLVNAMDGSTIWDLEIKGYPSAQNACWDGSAAYAFAKDEHLTVDIATGKVTKRVSLAKSVAICRHLGDGAYERKSGEDLGKFKKPITYGSNCLAGPYHYFRAHGAKLIGRVHVKSGAVEYLEVPVQVVRSGKKAGLRWSDAIQNDMRNSGGFLATQDKRNAGDGWGHVSAASPIVVGDKIYMPTMNGTVYVLKWDSPVLDEFALVSVSDLGPAGETWSLSSLSCSGGRLYARTLKELVCIGK